MTSKCQELWASLKKFVVVTVGLPRDNSCCGHFRLSPADPRKEALSCYTEVHLTAISSIRVLKMLSSLFVLQQNIDSILRCASQGSPG